MEKGYIQVYTGNGKGKTTAALGLSIRAAGAGFKVLISQFLKLGDYSEIKALKRFDDLITVRQYGTGKFVKGKPTPEYIQTSRKGLQEIAEAIKSNQYDLIIMEEANVAVSCGLFPIEELLDIVALKPDNLELVITGRNASKELIEKADLVTEMREIKHYYNEGVQARVGIEK